MCEQSYWICGALYESTVELTRVQYSERQIKNLQKNVFAKGPRKHSTFVYYCKGYSKHCAGGRLQGFTWRNVFSFDS